MSLSEPVRIAFCITELDPGGAERSLVELVTRLDRRQFEPVVYCLGPRPVGNPTSLVDRLEKEGVPVHCFGARRASSLPLLLTALRRQMRTDRPRIVQSFLFHANVAAAIAARWADVPTMIAGIRVAERRAAWHLRLARAVDRWVDRYVCVSESVRNFSTDKGRLSATKLSVIPNGVDVERFGAALPCSRERLGITPGQKLVVSIGRLDEQKDPRAALTGMADVIAQGQCDLLFVGDGPLRGALERESRRLKIDKHVHFAGFRSDVAEILAAADLLVLTSRWEGMPNVVLEAMAAGKPVVCRDVEGIRELLGPHAAPQVFQPSAADSLTSHSSLRINEPQGIGPKVVAILSQPDLAAQLGRENQRRAREHFSFDRMVAAYEQLYLSLLAPAE